VSPSLLIAAVADRYAASDAARMAELDQLLAARCRFCGARNLSERVQERTPGVCSRGKCQRRAKREAIAAAGFAPEPRRQPCEECGARTRHRKACSKSRAGWGGRVDARPSL
jgi:hypothetical protein